MEVVLNPRCYPNRPTHFIDAPGVHIEDCVVAITDRNGDVHKELLVDWEVNVSLSRRDYVF